MNFLYEKSIGIVGGYSYVCIDGVKGHLQRQRLGIMAEMDCFRSGICLVYNGDCLLNEATVNKAKKIHGENVQQITCRLHNTIWLTWFGFSFDYAYDILKTP